MTAPRLPTALALLFHVASVQSDETATSLSGDPGIRPEKLLEGFRPRRSLRLLAASWPLDDLFGKRCSGPPTTG